MIHPRELNNKTKSTKSRKAQNKTQNHFWFSGDGGEGQSAHFGESTIHPLPRQVSETAISAISTQTTHTAISL
jgi:hypothetical protein